VWTTGLYYYYAKDDSVVDSSGMALPVLDAVAARILEAAIDKQDPETD
jgi:hypothetical protein